VAPDPRDRLRPASGVRVEVCSHPSQGVAHPLRGLHGSHSRAGDPPPGDGGWGGLARLYPRPEVYGATGDARVGVEDGEEPVGEVPGPPEEESARSPARWRRKPSYRHGLLRAQEESVAGAGGSAAPVRPRLPSVAPVRSPPFLSHTS